VLFSDVGGESVVVEAEVVVAENQKKMGLPECTEVKETMYNNGEKDSENVS